MKNEFFYTFHQNWNQLKQKIFCVSLVSFLVFMPIFAISSQNNVYFSSNIDQVDLSVPSAASSSDNISQNLNVTWGGPNGDQGRGIAIDAGGNIYITGVTASDAFIVKYDSSGAQLWNTTWGGPWLDLGSGIAIDSDGNIYITGDADIYGVFYPDAFIVKYDSSGTQLWNTTWGGPSIEYGNGIAIDSSGNIYITGTTSSYGAGWMDNFIVKYDSSGALLWNTTWGGPDGEDGQGIAIDSSGNIYVTGYTSSYGAGLLDAFIVKYDSSGTLLWNTTWGGPIKEFGTGIAIDSSGNKYITGRTGSSWEDYDAFIVKYDSSDTLLWNITWGGPRDDGGQGIAVDSGGNIYMTGYTRSDEWGFDAFIAKYNSSGTLLWNTTWGGPDGDAGEDIAIDSKGNQYITGYTQNPGGDLDAFIVRYPRISKFSISGFNIVWLFGTLISTAAVILNSKKNKCFKIDR